MLHAFSEIALALLAALGLLLLGHMLFGRLLAPSADLGRTYAVIPADGDGAQLEQALRGLLWLRSGERRRFTVVIADDGLNLEGRALAQTLALETAGVLICTLGELPALLANKH